MRYRTVTLPLWAVEGTTPDEKRSTKGEMKMKLKLKQVLKIAVVLTLAFTLPQYLSVLSTVLASRSSDYQIISPMMGSFANTTIATVQPQQDVGNYQYVGGTAYTHGEETNALAQSFIPATNHTVYGLGIYAAAFTPGARIVMGLYSDGNWNGNEVADQKLTETYVVQINAINTWIDVSVKTPVTVTAGVRYWLVWYPDRSYPFTLYYNAGNYPLMWYCSVPSPFSETLPQQFCNWNFDQGSTSAYFYSRVIYTLVSQAQVEDALNLGMAYIDRLYQPCGNTGYYTVRDHMSIPLYIYNPVGNFYRAAGGQDGEGGGHDHTLIQLTNSTSYTIWFETEDDWNHDDIELNVTYVPLDATMQYRVDVTMLYYNPGNSGTVSVYLAGNLLGTGDWTSQTRSLTSPAYGWPSFRYAQRHVAQIAQEIYANRDPYGKGLELAKLTNDFGLSSDIYDPFFMRSGTDGDHTNYGSFPWPDYAQNWDRTWWDEYIYENSTWDAWWPRQLYGPNACYPYKSHVLGAPDIRDWQSQLLPNSQLWRLANAMQLMAQGNYVPGQYDVNAVRSLLDELAWDGTGVRREMYGTWSWYQYKAYPTYLTAYFLAAATMFAWSSGDATYKTYADQAAQVLLDLQIKQPQIHTADIGILDRPDSVGGFLAGYVPGGSYLYRDTGSHGVGEYYWEAMELAGWFSRMKAEMGIPLVTAMEVTGLSVWAIQVYEKYLLNGPDHLSFSQFTNDGTDCSNSNGGICNAFRGAADFRLTAIGQGTKAKTAIGWIQTSIPVELASGTTLTLRFFDHGDIAAFGKPGSLSLTMTIYDTSGHRKATQTWTIHSTTTTVYYSDKHIITWNPSIAIHSGYIIEIKFTVSSQAACSTCTAVADWAQAPQYVLNNVGFIHIGYLQAGTSWIAFGG
jgi:hypothetical protein